MANLQGRRVDPAEGFTGMNGRGTGWCILALGLAAAATASARPAPPPAVAMEWDEGTRTLVQRDAGYGRMARLAGGDILCAYDRRGQVRLKRSRDNGRTWGGETTVTAYRFGVATNPELLVLRDGTVLLSYNERPKTGVHPFAIRTARSPDGGATWSPPVPVYEADTRWENGCWEPAQVQLPSGEVHLFFANENPYRATGEQEITRVRSRDGGATWGPAERFSFRPGHRDGMPVPLVLGGGGGLVVAIEDNGLSGAFKPVILRASLGDNRVWSAIDGADRRRWSALATPLPPEVNAGAPYVRQLPGGETVLSVQSDEGGRRKPRMVVYVGDARARGFANPSVPFRVPAGTGAWWNSLFVKDAGTVTAVSGTTVDGVTGLWAIDGRVVRRSGKGADPPAGPVAPP